MSCTARQACFAVESSQLLYKWGTLSRDQGIETPILRGHNARGHVRNKTYWLDCSHKPECILTTKPDRSVSIMIIIWHVTLHPVDVSAFHVNGEYGVQSESCFMRFSHCYVTWCPLTRGIAASQYASWRDAVLATSYHSPLVSACLNAVYSVLTQENIFTTNLRTGLALLTLLLRAIIAGISHFMDS